MPVFGNQKLIRETNQKLIIDLVRKQGPLSRADLSKILKLSAPSVSSNIENLMSRGLIREIGVGEMMGSGRPPILLEFNRLYAFIAGIEISSETVRVALGDLQGNVIDEGSIDISRDTKLKAELFKQIIMLLQEIIQRNSLDVARLSCICIGTPGILNKETGFFQIAPRFEEWEKLNVKQLFEQHFQTTVMVMNDMNLAVIGENRFGSGRGFHNMIAINIDFGLGAGLMLNGMLYEGSRLGAGEIAYWNVRASLEERTNTPEDILDSYLSLYSVMNKVRSDLREGQNSNILSYSKNNLEKVDFEAFQKAVSESDPYCAGIVKNMVSRLAPVVANIVLLLDLELIIIGGVITKLGYSFIQPLREQVGMVSPVPTTIVFSELRERAIIYGSFGVALDHVMTHLLEYPGL